MEDNSKILDAGSSKSRGRMPVTLDEKRSPSLSVIDEVRPIETDFATPRRIGLIIAFLVFGVFGLWSALWPIDGSAHAIGSLTVRSYKKTIQHLEGGIVKDILVQNGDAVDAGDVILVLDPTQSLVQLEIYSGQLLSLKALESRLIAERDNLDSVIYSLPAASSDSKAKIEIDAQDQIFNARKSSHEGGIAVLKQRVEQLEASVVGQKALQESKMMLAASFEEELVDVRSLLAEGYADKMRLRELERNHAIATGEAAQLAASIASTEIQAGEAKLQMLQLQYDFQTEVVNQLSETQNKLKDVTERVRALTDVVARTEISAPVAGVVNGLQIHTIGGVIGPASPIAEIVPQSEELVIEVSVSPNDIDRVVEGQEALVRLSTFSSKSVPTLYGHVLSLSADTFRDENTGASYYLARVELDQQSIDDLQDMELLPGMPAEVFIQTGSRTFLQYLMKPLSNAIARSFIED